MTAPSSVDPARFCTISWPASPDLLRQMLTTLVNGLMSTEADVICGTPGRPVDPGADHRAQRLPAPGVRHPRRPPRRGGRRSCARAATSRIGWARVRR
jgi:hypothetical protein